MSPFLMQPYFLLLTPLLHRTVPFQSKLLVGPYPFLTPNGIILIALTILNNRR